jgi:hypothetical protein
MISLERQTFQQFEFPKLFRVIKHISKVGKVMSFVAKYLENFLMPFFWADCIGKLMQITARTFSCTINTQLLALFQS